jgi:hypothetical protein
VASPPPGRGAPGVFSLVRGRLEPEVGALLVRALEAARGALDARGRVRAAASGEAVAPTHGQRQADALALVAETALAHAPDPGPGRERYQVVLPVDAAVLADPARPGQCAVEDGVGVPGERPGAWPATPPGS